jgi:hypothetical protein
MATVRINTSDTAWIEHWAASMEDVIAHGADIKGVMYFSTEFEVPAVEHVKFAGASMIRFDLGPDGPRDHSRWAMYPESYLVSD